ncbi:MAG: peptidoglycan-binding protein, partial [Bacillus sp. (in: Bacteria)]|nr:peptidoglycan-binding protein [Bacillus sp. (in: firmicutes)]
PNARADADAHARLQENGNRRQASWHLQIDDKQCIQSIPFNEIALAAGDGKGPGNRTSIHIEICVNSDGDYKKAVAKTAEVTRQLMEQFNISGFNVVQHNKWSGKNCPSIMRSGRKGITWGDFINLISGVQVEPKPTPQPSPVQVKPSQTLLKEGSKGAAVKKLQEDLIKADEKLPRFGADGDFGEETSNAVKAFQARRGLTVDGIAGPNTLAKLEEVLKPKPAPVQPAPIRLDDIPYPGQLIKEGSRGLNVQRVQRVVGVNPDGIFGAKTKAAVKAYQSRHGLVADGIVGPATWSVLF